jgi:saccharopine dehydrogenase-like NADP-dependent oxidoreductase
MRIAVIGAGAMGRWAVKELAISPEVDDIVVGDYHEEQAWAVAAAQGSGKAKAVFVDARVDTGIPAAIVAKLMARGEIAGPGVFVPEQIVPCERFFSEFARWGVTVDAQMREILAAPEG